MTGIDTLTNAANALIAENTTLQSLISQFEATIPAEALVADILAGTADNLFVSPAHLRAALSSLSGSALASALFAALDARYVAITGRPMTSIVATPQSFAANSLARMTTLVSMSNSDVTCSGSVITINTPGKYVVSFSSQINVSTSDASDYVAAAAIYLNDDTASNILNQLMVQNSWNSPSGGFTAVHELQMSQPRVFAAGDHLTCWVEALGVNLAAFSTTGALINMVRTP